MDDYRIKQRIWATVNSEFDQKKGQQATNTARQELTVNSKNQGRVDVLINLR